MLYRPALHGNWNALSLARRALKDKFPTPAVPLTTVLQNCQLFRTLYIRNLLPYCSILTRACKYVLELLMMSGVSLETCWAFSKLWNNKFYYKAASCWYFYCAMNGCSGIVFAKFKMKYLCRHNYVFLESCSGISSTQEAPLKPHSSANLSRLCKQIAFFRTWS